MEKAIKDSVTKNHVEILLSGKLTHSDLHGLFQTLSAEIESLLGKKADFAQVEGLLGQKASMSTIEQLRGEMNVLRDSLRSGDGLGDLKEPQDGSKGKNPFEQYQTQLSALLEAIKDAQASAREEDVRRRAEEDARASSDANGRNTPGGSLIESERDADASRSQSRLAHDRLLFDAREKKELRDKIQRMELAIQLANAQNQALQAKRRRIGDAEGDEEMDDAQRLEKALDKRTGKLTKELEALRGASQQAERDLEKANKQFELLRNRLAAGGAGGTAYGAAGAMHALELQRFFQDLSELQAAFDAHTGASGRHILEQQLIPQADQVSSQVEQMRNLLRDQQRAHGRLLDSLADAKQSVSTDINELYRQVQALRRRLKNYTEQHARDVLRGCEDQAGLAREFDAFRSELHDCFAQLSQGLSLNQHTLIQMQQPLHDQLRAAGSTQVELREETLERRYEKEYARLRQRYEEISKQAHQQQQQQQQQLHSHEESKDLSSPGAFSPALSSRAGTRASLRGWDMYADVSHALSPSPGPGLEGPMEHSDDEVRAEVGKTGAAAARPRTSPHVGTQSSPAARRSSWQHAGSLNLSVASPDASNTVDHFPAAPSSRKHANGSGSRQGPSSTRAASASLARRPGTSSGTVRSGTPLHAYTRSVVSSFQLASPGTGPRWRPDHSPVRDGPNSARGAGPRSSAPSPPQQQRDANGHLLLHSPVGLPNRPGSRAFSLKQASKHRPISGSGAQAARASTPRAIHSAGGFTARASSRNGAHSALGVEHNDAEASLELLRQRLSIPLAMPASFHPPQQNLAQSWVSNGGGGGSSEDASAASSPTPQSRALRVSVAGASPQPMPTPSPMPAQGAPQPYPHSASAHAPDAHGLLKSSTHAPLDPFLPLHQPVHTLPGDAYAMHSPHSYTPRTSMSVAPPAMMSGASRSSRITTNVAARMK